MDRFGFSISPDPEHAPYRLQVIHDDGSRAVAWGCRTRLDANRAFTKEARRLARGCFIDRVVGVEVVTRTGVIVATTVAEEAR